MRKYITLSADGELIRRARLKAQQEHSTLNQQFRNWLKKYVNSTLLKNYSIILQKYDFANSAGSFTRDELNER